MEPLVFFNTAWMNRYEGLQGDPPSGGGRHVRLQGWGSEIYNFRPHRGRLYGFVRHSAGRSLNLERLGAPPDADSISGITVVWTAPKPHASGRYVVGWYRNATVLRHSEVRPKAYPGVRGRRRTQFVTTCRAGDEILIEAHKRTQDVPSRGRNVWYGDARTLRRIGNYIDGVESANRKRGSSGAHGGWPQQPDVSKRLQVEQAAMVAAREYLRASGFRRIRDVSAKKSWDYEAERNGALVRVEVKGLSGAGDVVQLTPAEYDSMLESAPYVLVVVRNALSTPGVAMFSRACTGWDLSGIEVEPRTGAVLRIPSAAEQFVPPSRASRGG